MAITPETGGAVAGALFIIANILGFWFREWRKHRTWAKNGESLVKIDEKIDEVKEVVAAVNGKVENLDDTINGAKNKLTEVRAIVGEQKENCTKTVKRIDSAMAAQSKELIQIAKNRR
jgi:peptidoglycan hydrolase CwlO-like protein